MSASIFSKFACIILHTALLETPFCSFWAFRQCLLTLALSACLAPLGQAQDRLESMPAYARYQRAVPQTARSHRRCFQGGSIGRVDADSSAYIYRKDGKTYKYDVAQQKSVETQEAPAAPEWGRVSRGRRSGTRQAGKRAASPDGKWKATYKDANVWLSGADDTNPFMVSQDGSRSKRLFYGTASWVYGEELEQHTAMWWSPDSTELAYYRFDESKVPDYYVTTSNLEIQDGLDTEPYPKAGAPNPVVDIWCTISPPNKLRAWTCATAKPS